jgi:hypothetical protein
MMNIVTGILSIVASLCISGSMIGLMRTFEYPRIIRKDPIYILGKLNQKGKIVPALFYLFGLGGFFLVFTSIALERLEYEHGEVLFSRFAMVSGVVYGVLLFAGILRYFKLFPQLADDYERGKIQEENARNLYHVANTYIGETVCEHVAFTFLSVMIFCNSISFFLTHMLNNVLSIGGMVIAIGLIIGNTEFLGFKKVFVINRIFSALSAIWIFVVGVCLII